MAGPNDSPLAKRRAASAHKTLSKANKSMVKGEAKSGRQSKDEATKDIAGAPGAYTTRPGGNVMHRGYPRGSVFGNMIASEQKSTSRRTRDKAIDKELNAELDKLGFKRSK